MGKLYVYMLAILIVVPSVMSSPLSFNNKYLDFTLEYPMEAKYGSIVNYHIHLTALENITINSIRFTVVFIHDRGSTTLFNSTILSSKKLVEGESYERLIQVRAQLNYVPSEPYLKAYVSVNYTSNGEDNLMYLKLTTTIVRSETYEELQDKVRRLEGLEDEVDRLNRQISELRLNLTYLESNLSMALGRYEELRNILENVSREKLDLLKELIKLTNETGILKAKVNALNEENVRLREELSYERARVEDLMQKLGDVYGRYNLTLSEFNDLKNKYSTLSSELTFYRTLSIILSMIVVAMSAAIAIYYLVKKGVKLSIPRRSVASS